MTQRLLGGFQCGFVHNTQLAAKLRDGTGSVDGAQDVFPEAATHRQDGVIGRDDRFVVGDVFELGAAQVAGDFTQVVAPDAVDFRLGSRFLGEDDFAGDVFDVPVAQRDLHREAAHQALQVGHTRQGRLARTDE